jgi:hypothetical protein
MHRMWSDGRWNKLYHGARLLLGKCTFCDISLDYIKMNLLPPIYCGSNGEMIAQARTDFILLMKRLLQL